jgi:DNA-binding transcriptional MerR regulator
MIPNKSSFKFQELPGITGVKPYVIRFWETEFEEISPVDSDSGQKIYSRKDVEVILKIKKLLFEDKLSVREAKARLNDFEVPVEDSPQVQNFNSENLFKVLNSGLEIIREIKRSRGWP